MGWEKERRGGGGGVSAGKQVSRRRFPCVQELSVLVRDRVELLPLCIRKSERGGGGGERRDLLKKLRICRKRTGNNFLTDNYKGEHFVIYLEHT